MIISFMKTGLGYDNQFHEKQVLVIREEEVTKTVFDNRSSDEENISLANDRFKKGKGTGHRESRLVWNDVQRINHQNKFAPTTVFTRSGRIPVSAAKPKAAASTSAVKPGYPQQALKNKRIVDIGCSRHMTRNKAYLTDYQEINDGGFVAFGSSRVKISEAVNTACYVLNRALVTKTHNKTPYELLNGRTPRLDVMRPFGYLVTILNTLDPLGKFKGKANKGFLVGYSVTSKAFRVFNTKTKKVKENQHVKFLENKPNVIGPGPNWLFDIDSLTNSMNYIPVFAGNQTDKNVGSQDTNGNAGTQDNVDTGNEVSNQHYIVLLLWSSISSTFKSLDDKATDDKPTNDIGSNIVEQPVNKEDQPYRDELDRLISQEKEASDAANALRQEFEQGCIDQRGVPNSGSTNSFNTDTAELQSTGIFNSAYDDDLDIFESPIQSVGAKADFNNMEPSTIVSHIPIHRVYLDHPKYQIMGDPKSVVQTRGMEKKSSRAHALVSYIYKQRRTNRKDYENCLFTCFLSQMEPKKVSQALDDASCVEAMQEELLQFSLQKVWRLVDLPYGKKAIETKWVYRNKKDERGIVVRNKARLVAQGTRQEEGIDYDEVFAPVAQIEAIRILFPFASYMGFIVYQMDIKSAFLYGIIEEDLYVCQPLGFIDP
nr:hypothetical protein [Tanacetum cinerariifolium]